MKILLHLMAVLFAGFAVGETLFFSVRDDLGGAMFNRFPFGETWFKDNCNASSSITSELLLKGGNSIELVLLVTEKGGQYTFQFEDQDGRKIYDARLATGFKEEEDKPGQAGIVKVEWLAPFKMEKSFEFQRGQEISLFLVQDNNGDWKWNKTEVEGEIPNNLEGKITLKIPYSYSKGVDAVPPWIGAERYQKSDFLEVKKVVEKYASLLVEKDVDALEPFCDERWKWQALCHGESLAKRKEIVGQSFQKHRNLLLGEVEVSKVDVFPLTSLIRISGPQVGLSLNGQPIFLEVFLFKKNNQWKIGL